MRRIKQIFILLALLFSQIAAPTVSALSISGTGGGTQWGGGGGGGYWGGEVVFRGVAGLRWMPTGAGTTIQSNMWGRVNTSPSEQVMDGIRYRANGQGSYYTVPAGYTGYYMQGYQFSNPSNAIWNDYNITRSIYNPWSSGWLFKTSLGGHQNALGAGSLPDPRAQQQAIVDGYGPLSQGVYAKGDHWLDAVFYQPIIKRTPAESKTIKKTIIKTENTKNDFDNSYKTNDQNGLKELYENAVTQIPYGDQTKEKGSDSGLPGFGYTKEIKANIAEIGQTITYEQQESRDNGATWSPLKIKSVKYELARTYYYKNTFKYDVKVKPIEQVWFKPFDLNRNGVANENDVVIDFPQYQRGGQNLAMRVDNKQNITDGKTGIQTLDTNTSTRFVVTFTDKMGLPSDKIKLLDSMPGSLSGNNPGKSGEFKRYVENDALYNSKDLNGNYTNYADWGGTLMAGVDTSNSSLTYQGKEQVGPSPIPIAGLQTGLDNYFRFKTIKIGDAFLTNGNGRKWWTLNYTRGNQYTYGLVYDGVVTVDGFGAAGPNITNQNMYTGWNSKQLEQPVLKGKFTAKTVAGDLGN